MGLGIQKIMLSGTGIHNTSTSRRREGLQPAEDTANSVNKNSFFRHAGAIASANKAMIILKVIMEIGSRQKNYSGILPAEMTFMKTIGRMNIFTRSETKNGSTLIRTTF